MAQGQLAPENSVSTKKKNSTAFARMLKILHGVSCNCRDYQTKTKSRQFNSSIYKITIEYFSNTIIYLFIQKQKFT